MAQLTEQWTANMKPNAKLSNEQAAQQALATYCHTMLNSAGFLYID
jgi:hypothetical protein